MHLLSSFNLVHNIKKVPNQNEDEAKFDHKSDKRRERI